VAMKKIAVLFVVGLTSCGAIHRHPTVTKIAIVSMGAVAGGVIAHRQNANGSCPNVYDGKPYSGTPPCPK
jgi:hypothetical protein